MTAIEILSKAAENIKIYRDPDISEATQVLDKFFQAYLDFDLAGKDVCDLWFAENKLFVVLSWTSYGQSHSDLFDFPLKAIGSADPINELQRLRVVEQLKAVKTDIERLAKQLADRSTQRDTLLEQLNEYNRD